MTASELRAWAGERLPAFKVPRVIRFLDEIPKGPTGKLQRVGLAAGSASSRSTTAATTAEHVPPRSAAETDIAEIWAEMFPGAAHRRDDPFRGARRRLAARGAHARRGERAAGPRRAVPGFCRRRDHRGARQRARSRTGVAGLRRWWPCAPSGSQRAALLHPGPRRRPAWHRSARTRAAVHQPVWAFDVRRLERAGSVEDLGSALPRPPAGARPARPVSPRRRVLRRGRRHRAGTPAHRAGQAGRVSRVDRRAQSGMAPHGHAAGRRRARGGPS